MQLLKKRPDITLIWSITEIRFLSSMLRRAQIRIGSRPLSEWLRGENRFEAKRGVSPNRYQAVQKTLPRKFQ